MALGEQIRDLRKAKGLTQRQLAELSESAERALQRLESGDGNPTLETLNKIAGALEATLIISIGSTKEETLFRLFRGANDRNKGLIIGYAEGLLSDHQPDPGGSRSKRSN